MRPVLVAVMLGICQTVVRPSAGQSLAEVSRATAAARKATADRPPAKVYTNQDVATVDRAAPPAPSGADSKPAPATPEPADASSKPAASLPPPDPKSEAYWRDRMRPLRARLDRARARADDTKRQADALTKAADRCFRIGVVCAEYAESLRLIEEHKWLVADLTRAEQDVVALQEEARRAGVPPGWLR